MKQRWNPKTGGWRALPTRQEVDLADEQPAVGEVELAAEDLSRPGTQREGDGSRRRVLQVLQGHVQGQGRGPGLEDPGLELTRHLVEHLHALRVTVVAVHLQQRDGRRDGHGPKRKKCKKEKKKTDLGLIIPAFWGGRKRFN